jgi:F-type H+-transporting ATPase subunit a
MDIVTTAAVAAAEMPADAKSQVHDYIIEHVMYHMAELDQWNVPFGHLRLLDVFRYDGVMLAVAAILLVLVCVLGYRRVSAVPHGLALVLEMFVRFIRDKISIAFLGEEDGRRLAPLFCSFFSFILFANLLGLVPIFSAATSNINVTGALAAVTLAFMVLGSIYRNGFRGFLKAFAPSGVPWPLLLILAPVEFLSMLSKAFALMIRLFANMLAGHIIIFSLLGLVVIFGYLALPVVALVILVFFFEIFVCIFQAYIFTLLSAIFMGQLYQPAH